MLFLQGVLESVDTPTTEALHNNLHRRPVSRGIDSIPDSGSGLAGPDGSLAVPLGAGEGDEALGLPLCVVCHNVSTARLVQVVIRLQDAGKQDRKP